MDPFTAVGVAASAAQLADFGAGSLLGLIRTLKALKEAPERLKILLDDLEHSSRFVECHRLRLRNIKSASDVKLSAPLTQPDSLNSVLDSADAAMLDLKYVLQPLVHNQTHQSLRSKTWRAIISVQSEKKILRKAERLEKLKHELTRELVMWSIIQK